MTAFWSAGNMLGVSTGLDLPRSRGVSGLGLLPHIDVEAGTQELAAELADE